MQNCVIRLEAKDTYEKKGVQEKTYLYALEYNVTGHDYQHIFD
jgi:hypothetical protein